jgi:hypothetical protein
VSAVGVRSLRSLRALALVATLLVAAGCWPAPGAGPDRRSHNPLETTITRETVATLAEAWTVQFPSEPWMPASVEDPVVSPRGVHVIAQEQHTGWPSAHTLGLDGTPRWAVSGYDLTFRGLVVQGERLAVTQHRDSEYWHTVWYDLATGTPGASTEGRLDAGRDGLQLLADASFFQDARMIRLVDQRAGTEWTAHLTAMSSRTPLTLGADRFFEVGYGMSAGALAPACCNVAVRAFPREDPQCDHPLWPDLPYTPRYTCPDWVTPVDGDRQTVPVLSQDQSTVYVATDAGTVYALDAATGAVRWTADAGAPVTAPPALAGGSLFVPASDGDLVVFDAGGCGAPTCGPVWTAAAGAGLDEQPAVAGGVVFTGSVDGAVRGYDVGGCGAATCDPLWSESTGSAITGAPAVAFGRLFVGTDDGRLVAYAPFA